jgi:hypothetical protein
LTPEEFDSFEIPVDDRYTVEVGAGDAASLLELGFKVNADGTVPTIYVSPMTVAMVEKMKDSPRIANIIKQVPSPETMVSLFPSVISGKWTRADYGGENGIWIPAKGSALKMNRAAWDIYVYMRITPLRNGMTGRCGLTANRLITTLSRWIIIS